MDEEMKRALRALLVEELKRLTVVEKRLLRPLQAAVNAAASETLCGAVAHHLEETETHAARLKQIGSKLGEALEGGESPGIQGIVTEGEPVLANDPPSRFKDVAIIGALRKAEHFEIASYLTARALAERAGETEVAVLLGKTLAEEEATDRRLDAIAGELEVGVIRQAD